MFQKIKPYLGHIVVLATLVCIGGTLFHSSKRALKDVRPKNAAEFAQTSAMITINDKNSGGSGVILSSSEKESLILTNKHVCEVIQGTGLVTTSGKDYKIKQFKVYKKHDLCLIKIEANLKVNTVVATQDPPLYSHAYVSGHPSLLPHVLTDGYFSDKKQIEIMTDIRPCKDEEFETNAMQCIFMGGIPVIKKFDSQLVTATIMPGSSGSGVFNEQGEISGLIFAGSAQGLSYGFIVPLSYIQDFLKNESQYKWRKPYVGSNQKFFIKALGRKIMIGCRSNKLYSESCEKNSGY